jgi:hypothetical protein
MTNAIFTDHFQVMIFINMSKTSLNDLTNLMVKLLINHDDEF